MRKTTLLLTLAAAGALLAGCSRARQAATVAIIPAPVELQTGTGTFTLDRSTVVVYPAGDSILRHGAHTIAERLGTALGSELKTGEQRVANAIVLEPLKDSDAKAEQYTLDITAKEIVIGANDYNGAFYALQTILQLLPEEVYNGKADASAYRLPVLQINDYPRFGWRGMHLDVSRHFFGVDFVKRYLDLMAMHKLNVFHWHLTDAQGWRLEIKRYPLLTEIGAWRVDRRADGWNTNREPEPGEEATYGGFYTQDEVREILAYAAERGIQVIPEIDVPGHSTAVFAAYPELSCLKTEQFVTPGGYFPRHVAYGYCAGNEEVYTFLRNIFEEVVELFPNAPYIHIGGDEMDKQFWEECPDCQAHMKAHGLKDVDELQSYFIHRMEEYVNELGKPIIGWDEILEGGLAPNATVMSWRGEKGGIEAAEMGHDVVMTPDNYLYFDHYQNDPQVEPRAMSGLTTVRKVYGYEPIPAELSPDKRHHILGAQANMWNEQVQTPEHVEYMVLPRMSALSEVVWSPREKRDYEDFADRLEVQLRRFDAMGLNYHPGADQIEFQLTYDSIDGSYRVALRTELHKGEMYYTMDGSEPTTESARYTGPVTLTDATTVKVIAARSGKHVSRVASQQFLGSHKAIGKQITYNTPPARNYATGSLADGLTGTTDHTDGSYVGLSRRDFDATVDMGEPTAFTRVLASFLQNAGSWIYLPQEVIFSVSDDGENFTEIGRATHRNNPNERPVLHHLFTVEGDYIARYIRVVGINGITPSGLSGAGQRNFLFIDEIFVL